MVSIWEHTEILWGVLNITGAWFPPLEIGIDLVWDVVSALLFLCFFKLQLIYNVVLISAVQQNNAVIYISTSTHTYSLSHIITSIMFYPKRLDIQYPMLYSRTSLLIHSKCISLHLPIPNSPSIPLSPHPPRQPQDCSLCL